MTKEKMFALIDSILEDAIRAIDARREDILQIVGECLDQAPEVGDNDEAVELILDLLRVDDGEELMQWLVNFYDEKPVPHKNFYPVLKEDYLE